MNKKKTTAILSLTFAFATAFGGSTLLPDTKDVNQKLNYNLDKLEAFSECTDWTNPETFLYGDEMFLGYDNDNYYYYTPKATPNFNTRKTNDNDTLQKQTTDVNQNDATKSNAAKNTNKSSTNTDNNAKNLKNDQQNRAQNFENNQSTYNQNINTTNQYNPNVRGKIDTMQRAPNLDTYKNPSADYGVDPIKRNNVNNTNNTFNTNNLSNNYGNNLNNNYGNTNNTNPNNNTYVAPNGTTATVAAEEISENKSILLNYENQLSDVNNQLKTSCSTLKQNIKSVRTNLENNANANKKALKAYNRVLNKITHKLYQSRMELIDATSRLYILAYDKTNSDLIDAQIIELKSIMSTQNALYECANQALTDINNLLSSNEALTKNTRQIDSTMQNANQITNPSIDTNQIEQNNVRNVTKAPTNQQQKATERKYTPIENNRANNEKADLEQTSFKDPTLNQKNVNNYNQNTNYNNPYSQNDTSMNINMPKLPVEQ